jgi:hypothetical protein
LLGWKVVRSYNEFIKAIEENGLPTMVSFDHDLADEHYDPDLHGSETYNELYDSFVEKTGYDCAKWLIDYCAENKLALPETILVHSMNPAGTLNIKSIFNSYHKSLGLPKIFNI